MARGWESKSVDDQIASAEAASTVRATRELTSTERMREARIADARLARARALQELQLACDGRRRAALEQAVVDLDQELERLARG